MIIANLAVLLIILACIVSLYLKMTCVKSFGLLFSAIFADIAAFSYFEQLSELFIGKAGNARFPAVAPWAQPLCFFLIFILSFAIFHTVAGQLAKKPINLGIADKPGQIICGILLGIIISGTLLTILSMAPLPNKYPYQRFDENRLSPENPNKVFLNTDGLITGLFAIVSKSSFSGKNSFATIHPDFINQSFLNRINTKDDMPIFTAVNAIQISAEDAVVPAPENIKDEDDPNAPIPSKTGTTLKIIRVGIKKNAMQYARKFTLSQIRIICKEKSDTQTILKGEGTNEYPIGYMTRDERLKTKKLNDPIVLESSDFEDSVKYFDFVFYLPNNMQPVLVEFKQNDIALIPKTITSK